MKEPEDIALETAKKIVKDWFCAIVGDWHRGVCEQAVANLIRHAIAEETVSLRNQIESVSKRAEIYERQRDQLAWELREIR